MLAKTPKSSKGKSFRNFAQRRFQARLAAVQALYQMDLSGTGIYAIIKEYENFHLGKIVDNISYEQADVAWFRKLVLGVVEHQKTIDPILNNILDEKWSLSRLDMTLRAIFRVAAWEIIYERDLSLAIIISQYVDIARAFFDDEEPKVTNSVLDTLGKSIRK
ncbi:transcription antitermination factor NusB [Bartonella sp. DGB1]|uniref:transcription antitermination factor NusB n=1 Tax=Bartonella sp. DGB1 TaxID=3239807 RepID=UPI0035260EDB